MSKDRLPITKWKKEISNMTDDKLIEYHLDYLDDVIFGMDEAEAMFNAGYCDADIVEAYKYEHERDVYDNLIIDELNKRNLDTIV